VQVSIFTAIRMTNRLQQQRVQDGRSTVAGLVDLRHTHETDVWGIQRVTRDDNKISETQNGS